MDGNRSRGVSLAAAFAAAACLCAPAQAATITADPTAADGVAADAKCSLREAITAANANSTGGGDCTMGSGTDTVQVPAGTYTLTGAANDDLNASGDLDVTESATIAGAGAGSTTISANGVDRVMQILAGATVTVSGLTIRDGAAPAGAIGTPSTPGQDGGGIASAGALTLSSVTVTANAAGAGASGGNAPGTGGSAGGRGGGIASRDTLTIVNSTISANFAGNGGDGTFTASPGGGGGLGGSGGGIDHSDPLGDLGPMTISGSTVTGNHAGNGGAGGGQAQAGSGGGGGSGGGIHAAAFTLTDTVVSGNSAGDGGVTGIDTDGNNGAAGGAGGRGGGIYSFGLVSLVRARVTGNEAGSGGFGNSGTPSGTASSAAGGQGGDGGGVGLEAVSTVEGSTIEGNSAGAGGTSPRGQAGPGGRGGGVSVTGPLTVMNSLVAANAAGGGGASATAPAFAGSGGGIAATQFAPLQVTNVTVTGNRGGNGGNRSGANPSGPGGGGGGGGGIDAGGGAALLHVTLHGNETGTGGTGSSAGTRFTSGNLVPGVGSVQVTNSIIASGVPANCAGTFTNGGNNVVFGDTSCTGLPVAGDPLLSALADNGGPTRTMALGDGSSALDVVPTGSACTAADQRGTSRPQGPACDAGAYERTVTAPASGGDQTAGADTGTQAPSTTAVADRTPPVVVLRLVRQRLLRALRRGYVVGFSTSETGRAAAVLTARGRDARGAAVKRVATGRITITKAGAQRLVVKFTKRARRAFARRKKVTLTLRLTVSDAAGNRTVKTARVVLRR